MNKKRQIWNQVKIFWGIYFLLQLLLIDSKHTVGVKYYENNSQWKNNNVATVTKSN